MTGPLIAGRWGGWKLTLRDTGFRLRMALRSVAWLVTILAVVLSMSTNIGFAQTQRLVLEVGKGLQLQGTNEAETLFVADPDVADLSSSPGEAHFLYGKRPGETTVIAVDVAGTRLFQYDVVVIHNLAAVQRMIAQRFPGVAISVRSARGSIYVSGTVSDERTYEAIIESLKNSVPDSILIDELAVAESRIVRLDVKLMEVARDQLESYGINWSMLASNGPGSCGQCTSVEVDVLVKLLLEHGVASVLSETTLTTASQKKATFMVGEEIAVPTYASQESGLQPNFGVDYRFIGMNIGFTPQLTPGQKVNLEIDAEISNLRDTAQFISGNRVPNIASRKLETSVELESRQSYILAGLSQIDTNAATPKPRRNWGAVGELSRRIFGKDEITSRHRDLIIVVTPHFGERDKPSIAEVVDLQQSNLEYILSRKSSGKYPTFIRLFGPSGFLY